MSSSKSSNHIALLALLSLIPIFIYVIGHGWSSILAPYVQLGEGPLLDKIAVFIASSVLGLVAVILAWAVASERARLRQEKTSPYTWIAYLVFLFALSALGTMNWLFKVSASAEFITETAKDTEKRLSELDSLARDIPFPLTDAQLQKKDEQKIQLTALITKLEGELDAVVREATDGQEQGRNRIVALMDAFEAEITNELRAGCGEVAQGYINDIKQQLGADLNLPSGNCNDAKPDVVVRTYRAAIEKALERRYGNTGAACMDSQQVKDIAGQIEQIIQVPPTPLGEGCPSREAVLGDTERVVKEYIAGLPDIAPEEVGLKSLRDESRKTLGAQTELVKGIYTNAENLRKENALPVLQDAWSAYRKVYMDIKTSVDAGKLAELPASIDNPNIEKIGAIANTIEILAKRYDHFSTYPIVLAGILFDLILIAFFSRVEASRSVKRPPPNEELIDKILGERERDRTEAFTSVKRPQPTEEEIDNILSERARGRRETL